MATCKHCGKESEAVNHNGRGWRCRNCWERWEPMSVDMPAETAQAPGIPEPETPAKAKRAPAPRPRARG